MNRALVFLFIVLVSCGGGQASLPKPENALDAGREFINACNRGDFAKASFYMIPDEANKAKLTETERLYREKDKEGRQQARSSSILIGELKELNDSTTLIYYQNSFDKKPGVVEVLKQNGSWLVNFATHLNPVP